MKQSGTAYGRSDVARLLGIDEWYLANFANVKRYPFKLRPTFRPAKGRGMKGLYGVDDIYKIALAHRMLLVGLKSQVVADMIHKLFPKGVDIQDLCVTQRAKKVEHARFLVVDFSVAPWVKQGKLPEHWRKAQEHSQGSEPDEDQWISLEKWSDLNGAFAVGNIFSLLNLRTALIMPFDELLAEVDARLLGRQFRLGDYFDMSHIPPIPDVPELSDEEREDVLDQIRREENEGGKA